MICQSIRILRDTLYRYRSYRKCRASIELLFSREEKMHGRSQSKQSEPSSHPLLQPTGVEIKLRSCYNLLGSCSSFAGGSYDWRENLPIESTMSVGLSIVVVAVVVMMVGGVMAFGCFFLALDYCCRRRRDAQLQLQPQPVANQEHLNHEHFLGQVNAAQNHVLDWYPSMMIRDGLDWIGHGSFDHFLATAAASEGESDQERQ